MKYLENLSNFVITAMLLSFLSDVRMHHASVNKQNVTRYDILSQTSIDHGKEEIPVEEFASCGGFFVHFCTIINYSGDKIKWNM